MSAWSVSACTLEVTLVACSLLFTQACTSNSNDGAQPPGMAGSSGPSDNNASGGHSASGGSNASGESGGSNQTSGGSNQTSGGSNQTSSGSNQTSGSSQANGESFAKRVLVDGLADPWEISWGPDASLWVTERTGKRVIRIRPSDGTVHAVLKIDEVRQEGDQDGLLGM